MELDKIRQIGVIGAGLMGHGIAQVFASAGYNVNLYDADQATLDSAKGRIEANFKVFVALGLAKQEDVESCLSRVTLFNSIGDLGKISPVHHRSRPGRSRVEKEDFLGGRELCGSRHYPLKQHLGDKHHRDRGGTEQQGTVPGDALLEPAACPALCRGHQGRAHR